MTIFDHDETYEDVYFAGTEDEHNSGGSPVPLRELPRCSSAELREAMSTLTARQRFVLERSWGLDGHGEGGGFSFRLVAESWGVDVAAVHRHYTAAMDNLRAALANVNV